MTDTAPAEPASKTSIASLALTGMFGLVGVLLGGLLQYHFGSSRETEQQRLQIQLSAYADLAKAQAALQRAQHDDARKRAATVDDANLKIRDAAFRVVIFSPTDVVKTWAASTREAHPEACGPTPTKADVAVYKSMRRQIRDDDVPDDDVVMALFGCKMK